MNEFSLPHNRDIIGSFSGCHSFLSNFYTYQDGMSAEHYYQAAKTLDARQRDWVMASETPGIAKRRGRHVDLRLDWEYIKDCVMMNILIDKFSGNAALRNALLKTGNAVLVEGNTWGDTYWGVCDGIGQNKLGELLMIVRAMMLYSLA